MAAEPFFERVFYERLYEFYQHAPTRVEI